MPVKADLIHTWMCICGKWNAAINEACWKCKQPKVLKEKRRKSKNSGAVENIGKVGQ